MRRMLTLVAFAVTACSPLVLRSSPLPDQEGARAFSVNTVYGGLDGPIESARALLERESKRLCSGTYKVANEQDIARLTNWGSPNGQRDLMWQVRCAS